MRHVRDCGLHDPLFGGAEDPVDRLWPACNRGFAASGVCVRHNAEVFKLDRVGCLKFSRCARTDRIQECREDRHFAVFGGRRDGCRRIIIAGGFGNLRLSCWRLTHNQRREHKADHDGPGIVVCPG
jgi:hypothetical protein